MALSRVALSQSRVTQFFDASAALAEASHSTALTLPPPSCATLAFSSSSPKRCLSD
eukprot:CAMPEP_0114168142 /NCGR_PEP_ID=MMETSP0043_2-20121206/32823_1 /TAXON_ID=464988 /ORGANISM="Hemiselmis andersenii, Strain CCMP644" /LENGTH=55 /DNA_ID=CAMNT_0001265409 /DNA_START=130 /DNA_END=297 /DNA_ORIENTATION=-